MVKIISLDIFIQLNKIIPDILKIDVEGSELAVLKRAKFLLNSYKLIIFLSTQGPKIKKECFRYLHKLRYNIFHPINSDSVYVANEFLIRK